MGLSQQVTDTILGLVDQYGLLAIFVALVLDSAMILPFVPGELLLVIAVNRMAPDPVSLVFVILVCTAGTVAGSFLLFLVGKYGGRRFILKHPRLFLMSPERRDKLERTFRRPIGQSLVLIFRFFPFLRIIVSLPAGLARMPAVRFLVLTTIGSFAFNGAVMWLVYETRQPGSRVVSFVSTVRTAYLDPLVELAMANLPWVVGGALVLGILSMLRRNVRMVTNPLVPARNTLLGTITVAAFFWGGVSLVAGLWTDPEFVYDLVANAGWDVVAATDRYFLGPIVASAGAGVALSLFALFLMWFQHKFVSSAERRRAILREEFEEPSPSAAPYDF